MHRLMLTTMLLAATIGLIGCGEEVGTSLGPAPREWLVPVDEVIDGGPGRDGIPSVDRPIFFEAQYAQFVVDTSLVVGVRIGGEARAYPEPILNYHEIVNDVMGDIPISVTYCPLTGSALVWNRTLNGNVTTFGVSGLLYNSNLMPYDRATSSTWSQMSQLCVNGSLKGLTPEGIHAVETTWKTWREAYPNTKILAPPGPAGTRYGHYPYRDYRTNHNLLYTSISNDDRRLPRKVRVAGVIYGSESKVYPLESFGSGISVINDDLPNFPVVVAGSFEHHFGIIFERATMQQPTDILTFTAVQNALPAVMVDEDGSHYDLFGVALDGPRAGQQLIPTDSYVSMWFAWGTFHPGALIHGQ